MRPALAAKDAQRKHSHVLLRLRQREVLRVLVDLIARARNPVVLHLVRGQPFRWVCLGVVKGVLVPKPELPGLGFGNHDIWRDWEPPVLPPLLRCLPIRLVVDVRVDAMDIASPV